MQPGAAWQSVCQAFLAILPLVMSGVVCCHIHQMTQLSARTCKVRSGHCADYLSFAHASFFLFYEAIQEFVFARLRHDFGRMDGGGVDFTKHRLTLWLTNTHLRVF